MPSRSKSQQRLFGMVHAYQSGKLSRPPAKIESIAGNISKSDAKDFAKTKHDGLPERKEASMPDIRSLAITKLAAFVRNLAYSVPSGTKAAELQRNTALSNRLSKLAAAIESHRSIFKAVAAVYPTKSAAFRHKAIKGLVKEFAQALRKEANWAGNLVTKAEQGVNAGVDDLALKRISDRGSTVDGIKSMVSHHPYLAGGAAAAAAGIPAAAYYAGRSSGRREKEAAGHDLQPFDPAQYAARAPDVDNSPSFGSMYNQGLHSSPFNDGGADPNFPPPPPPPEPTPPPELSPAEKMRAKYPQFDEDFHAEGNQRRLQEGAAASVWGSPTGLGGRMPAESGTPTHSGLMPAPGAPATAPPAPSTDSHASLPAIQPTTAAMGAEPPGPPGPYDVQPQQAGFGGIVDTMKDVWQHPGEHPGMLAAGGAGLLGAGYLYHRHQQEQQEREDALRQMAMHGGGGNSGGGGDRQPSRVLEYPY